MRGIKRFGIVFLSFSLITLTGLPLGPEGRFMVAENLSASWPTRPNERLSVIQPGESRPLARSGDRLPLAEWCARELPQEPPATLTVPADVMWKYDGNITESGQRQINHLALSVTPRPTAGPLPAEATSSSLSPITVEWPAPAEHSLPSAAAPAQSSILVNVSPTNAFAGSEVTVSGKVPAVQVPTVPTVRILFRDCEFTRGLGEAPVSSDGSFSARVKIPSDATTGPHELMVTGGSTSVSNTPPLSGNFVVNIPPLPPGSISGTILLERASGGEDPAFPQPFWLDNTEKEGGPGSLFSGKTDSNGRFYFPSVPPGKYSFIVVRGGYVFETFVVVKASQGGPVRVPAPVIEVKPAEELTDVIIVGKLRPAGVGACIAWKQTNEDAGLRLPMGATIEASAAKANEGSLRHIGYFVSGVPVTNQFIALVPFPLGNASLSLEFLQGDKVVKTVAAQPEAILFSASVNMDDLPVGLYRVRTVIGGQCALEPSLEFRMVDLGWNNPWVKKNQATFKDGPPRYEFSGLLPAPLGFSFKKDINLVDITTLHNEVTFGIPISETFYLDGKLKGQAQAQAKVTLLSQSLLNETLNYTPKIPGAPFGFLRQYYWQDQMTLFDKTDPICKPCFWIGLVPEILDASVSASLHFGGFVDFDSTIKSNLGVSVGVTPGAYIGIPIDVEVHLLLLANFDGSAEPKVTVELPIECDITPSVGCDFLSPCLRGEARVCGCVYSGPSCGCEECFGVCVPCSIDWWEGCTDWKQLFSWGCGSSATSLITEQDQPPPARPPSPSPSVASDGSGHALSVWLQTDDSSAERSRLFFSFYDGRSWSSPQPVFAEPRALASWPKVAFIGPNRAVAVWMNFPATNRSRILSDEGLAYAIWDGRRWSEPMLLTNDPAYDAKPSLAADPKTGQAMVVWLRASQPESLGPTSRPDGIYYSRFDGRQWSAPALVTPPSTAIDFFPSVKFDRRGQAAAVWMRDVDGDVNTSEDRQIVMSRFDRRSWSLPEPIPDLPPGPYTPSLAFDRENNPIVVFVVPPLDPQTGRSSSGVGTNNQLYSAYRRQDRWEVVPVGQTTFAETPVVNVNPDNRAIIMYRQFGDTSVVHASGDLAAAVADLNVPRLEWTTGYLTNDGMSNWKVAFDIDEQTSANFVVNVKKVPGNQQKRTEVAQELARLPKGERVNGTWRLNTLGGVTLPSESFSQAEPDISVASFVIPYAVDLAVTPDDLTISNTHPIVGEQVTVTATIRNAGLKAISSREPFTVKLYDGDPSSGGAVLIEQQRIEQAMPFNAAVPISFTYTVSRGGLQTLAVVVNEENAIAESSKANNTALVTFGQMPAPLQLSATADSEQPAILLVWGAPDTQGINEYQIFRSTRPGGPYEFVGDTLETSFTDTLVRPGVTYYYVVVAVDAYGVRSAFSNEATARLP
ncbi:MAG TPA: CARDB domain-containing protein [Blastocatellia bacterium]|nr:CARDB domain-containing protein [Blastocatellia bacterium]